MGWPHSVRAFQWTKSAVARSLPRPLVSRRRQKLHRSVRNSCRYRGSTGLVFGPCRQMALRCAGLARVCLLRLIGGADRAAAADRKPTAGSARRLSFGPSERDPIQCSDELSRDSRNATTRYRRGESLVRIRSRSFYLLSLDGLFLYYAPRLFLLTASPPPPALLRCHLKLFALRSRLVSSYTGRDVIVTSGANCCV